MKPKTVPTHTKSAFHIFFFSFPRVLFCKKFQVGGVIKELDWYAYFNKLTQNWVTDLHRREGFPTRGISL